MGILNRLTPLLGITLCFSQQVLAQVCPTPTLEEDGFWRIQLETVELKLRPGQTSSDLVLSQVSPLTGETETQRATIRVDGALSERTALLQVNRYDFEPEDLAITTTVTAVLAAGYTPTGGLNIGYGAKEGGFLVLIEGERESSACLPYPEKAAFGEWNKAISVLGLDIREVTSRLATAREERRECLARNSILTAQGTTLESANSALRERVRNLEAELARERLITKPRIFDLSRLIRVIFNEAQDNVKRRYPGDRKALSVIREKFRVAVKANRRNIRSSPTVAKATRESLSR